MQNRKSNAKDIKESSDQYLVPTKLSGIHSLIIGLVLTSIIAIILSGTQFVSDWADGRGEIGDLFGGILNPIIAMFSAWLIYKTFTEQVKANGIQIAAISAERKARLIAASDEADKVKQESDARKFESTITAIRQEIDKLQYFQFSQFDNSIEQIYSGIYAAYMFSLDFKSDVTELTWRKNEATIGHILSVLFMFNRSKLVFDAFSKDRMYYSGELAITYSHSIYRAIETILSRDIIPTQMTTQISKIKEQKEEFEKWANNLLFADEQGASMTEAGV